jgi:methyl-accepting chemotaxis protein
MLTVLLTLYLVLARRTAATREADNARKLEEANKKAEENERLNDSIIDIMRAVAKLAKGDLTIQAPVREDITGALSDAINSMAESTAKTLAGVAGVSHEVRSASQEGRDSVLQTSRGMNDIRGTIQETGKRIKRLGERSQEITGIVKLIDDIAERTSVLALNANMQAAMAGEAGRGFRVVADEVQRLAERSKEATDQIAKLVTTIQAETNDTMVTMDRAIGEVVKGGELADKAAEKVTQLDELGGQLLESVGAFTLPAELAEKPAAERGARDSRRAA